MSKKKASTSIPCELPLALDPSLRAPAGSSCGLPVFRTSPFSGSLRRCRCACGCARGSFARRQLFWHGHPIRRGRTDNRRHAAPPVALSFFCTIDVDGDGGGTH
uniref:Uncharacterized protein n=1 Tax=Oryza meridionalis TaxID=40149 RepID=A0A0E0EGK6_9ORYZ